MESESDSPLGQISKDVLEKIDPGDLTRIRRNQAHTLSIRKLQRVFEILHSDVMMCAKGMMETDGEDQFWRRATVRAVFAWIEGVAHGMRQLSLHTQGTVLGHTLTQMDVTLLREESYCLNQRGHPKKRINYLRIDEGFRFSFHAMAQAYGIDYELDTGSEGWRAFSHSMDVRNRLTHPRSADTLTVSDEDIQELTTTIRWFAEQFSNIIRACMTSFLRLANEHLEKARQIPDVVVEKFVDKISHVQDIDFLIQLTHSLPTGTIEAAVPGCSRADLDQRLRRVRGRLLDALD